MICTLQILPLFIIEINSALYKRVFKFISNEIFNFLYFHNSIFKCRFSYVWINCVFAVIYLMFLNNFITVLLLRKFNLRKFKFEFFKGTSIFWRKLKTFSLGAPAYRCFFQSLYFGIRKTGSRYFAGSKFYNFIQLNEIPDKYLAFELSVRRISEESTLNMK